EVDGELAAQPAGGPRDEGVLAGETIHDRSLLFFGRPRGAGTHSRAMRYAQRRAPATMCSGRSPETPGPTARAHTARPARQDRCHSVAATQMGQWFSTSK